MKKLFFTFIFILAIAGLNAKSNVWAQRIEPSFWWTGMHNSQLQLMLYGPELGGSDISIDYPGISIERKEVTTNPHYVFLYLQIGKEAKPGKFNIILKKGKQKQTLVYELKARREGSAERESFSEADAVYLLMPDRFANGNTSNDSVKGYYQGVNRKNPAMRHGGDIEGIISKIPYIADLGATVLWTTPVLENNDTAYSYHHYGCTDYYKVDPRLGKNEDYLRLSSACHAHGMKLIIDVVPNHCCSQHWWMKDLPSADWLNQWDGYTSSNYRITAWTDPYASQSDLKKLTKGWFAPNMPDLNLNNPLLFDYLRQVYVFWIEYANIDGMRVDTYPYNDIRVASRFIGSIRNEYPWMNAVGECWVKTSAETAYFQSGNNNKDHFDSQLPSVMDFCLRDAFCFAFNEKESWEGGMARFYLHYAQDFVFPNSNMIMNFLDNHDTERFSTMVQSDTRKFKMGLALLTTSRGYPQIYYGTEIMQAGTPGSYEGCRSDFPGGWATDPRNAFIPEGRTNTENEIFDYTKKLLNYRKTNSVLQNGKMKQFIPENGLYVYFRYNQEKTIMVIANNNDETRSTDLTRYQEMLTGKNTGKEIYTGETFDLQQPVSIKGKTVLILELK